MIRATARSALVAAALLGIATPVSAQGKPVEDLTVAGMADEVYVVAIGNNAGHPDDVTLRFAESDASEFARVMRHLGSAASQNVVLTQGEDKERVQRVLVDMNRRVRERMSGKDLNTAMVVYYSGHADARGLHLGETTIPFDDVKALVESSAATVRILILDACRSGGATRVKGVTPTAAFDIGAQNRLAAEGMAVITSSAANEDSHESDRLGGSFFTHHLISGLRGAADDNRDGSVTLGEVYSYAYQQTLRSSGRTLNLQHPTFDYDIKGKGDVTLTRLGRRSARLAIAEAGQYLVISEDEDGAVVSEVMVGEQGAELVLSPGRYFVQHRTPSHYLEFEISLKRGRTTSLAEQSGRRVAYARLLRKGGGDSVFVHGLYVLGGVRGEILSGQGATPNVVLGYTLDLPWFALSLRARWTMASTSAGGALPNTRVEGRHMELALGLTAQRFFDLDFMSLGVGLAMEGSHVRQDFDSNGAAPSRESWAMALGAIVTLERELAAGIYLSLEGGPMAVLLRQSQIAAGTQVGADLATPVTWWIAGGAGWRF